MKIKNIIKTNKIIKIIIKIKNNKNKKNNNSLEKRAISLNEGRAGCGRCSLNPFEPKCLNPKPGFRV